MGAARLSVLGGLIWVLVAGAALPGMTSAGTERVPGIPMTPQGLSRCEHPMAPTTRLLSQGEQLVYDVNLLGVGIGRAHLSTRSLSDGATLYLAAIEPARFVAGVFRVEGAVSAQLPAGAMVGGLSELRYGFRDTSYVEEQRIDADGRIQATRTKNGKAKRYERDFEGPVLDLLSSVALARELPERGTGCALLVNDGRAFTLWTRHVKRERVEVGDDEREVMAERYEVRYGSDRGKKIEKLNVWVSTATPRIVLRAESDAALAPKLVLREHRGPTR